MQLNRSNCVQLCDYELSYKLRYEKQLGFFEKERELIFLWCLSDEFDNLQELKPDQYCDELENGSLTGSIIACIEEDTLELKFGIKKSFLSCSTEPGQYTMKEVKGALAVKNNSLKSARTNLSTI